MIKIKEMGWNFDNSYIALPKIFYSKIDLNPVCCPEMVIFNKNLSKSLGLNSDALESEKGVYILSGSKEAKDGAYIAEAYAGHQFGYFTMLGDSRAVLIGEQITPSGERYDIQLKGSGKTPYSRGGDGRAVLGPMIREYIISEAMNGLGIPTTRSLAVIKTGEIVHREEEKQGAILTRVASSHVRFGTFQYAARFGNLDDVKALADYCINRHYNYIKNDSNKYINFLKEIIKIHAFLVAKWQTVGFIHGVMNTDNMTISGETIDYGPCAFMDVYNPDTVFSSIDINGRYAYSKQPVMAQWNLCRFAETLLPLLHDDRDMAIKIAEKEIAKFSDLFYEEWMRIMRFKLGIFNEELQDRDLIENLLSMMKKFKEDYTNTFLSLTFNEDIEKDMFKSEEFKDWYKSWQERLKRQSKTKEEAYELMSKSNPVVIPRNHRVEEAIEAADKGDFEVMKKLLYVVSSPYEHSKEHKEYSKIPKASNCPYRTFCGT